MGWESFDVIRFDLWPLFQGQMRIARINSAYISLIDVPRGLQCHQPMGNHGLRIFSYCQISPWASPSRLSDV